MEILLELLKIYIEGFREGLRLFVDMIIYSILVMTMIILFKGLYKYLKIIL